MTQTGYIEFGTFAGDTLIHSPQFSTLDLTSDQVFVAGQQHP